MNIDTLSRIAQFKALSQSDLANAAGVSRQSISLWFKQQNSFVPISSQHLKNLSDSLQVSSDILLNELQNQAWWDQETTNLLWDSLYKNLPRFLAALRRGEPKALARLVDIYGLITASKVVGSIVFKQFESFKKYLPPVRQKELHALWQMLKNHHLI